MQNSNDTAKALNLIQSSRKAAFRTTGKSAHLTWSEGAWEARKRVNVEAFLNRRSQLGE